MTERPWKLDPAWLEAREDYERNLPGETALAALQRRIAAANRMYEIEQRHLSEIEA